jgi:hypothetical protein
VPSDCCRLVSVFFVVLAVVFHALYHGTYTNAAYSFTWIVPVEIVTIGWFVMLSSMPIGVLPAHSIAKKIIYMEFLCLWSTISAALSSELLLVRFHVV